ncbi:MAG: hypothetical protein ACKVS6_16240 [Planctomycetota bacterium]
MLPPPLPEGESEFAPEPEIEHTPRIQEISREALERLLKLDENMIEVRGYSVPEKAGGMIANEQIDTEALRVAASSTIRFCQQIIEHLQNPALARSNRSFNYESTAASVVYNLKKCFPNIGVDAFNLPCIKANVGRGAFAARKMLLNTLYYGNTLRKWVDTDGKSVRVSGIVTMDDVRSADDLIYLIRTLPGYEGIGGIILYFNELIAAIRESYDPAAYSVEWKPIPLFEKSLCIQTGDVTDISLPQTVRRALAPSGRIWIAEAAEKYNIPKSTIDNWCRGSRSKNKRVDSPLLEAVLDEDTNTRHVDEIQLVKIAKKKGFPL